MTAPSPAGVAIDAPAKLNLGLEIVGRRADGYHDLVTIFQAISIRDRLHLSPAPEPGLRLTCDDPSLADDNLARAALVALCRRTRTTAGATLRIEKRIPVAAGLGGASSDAAAALLAGRRLWGLPLPDDALAALAAEIGSDTPFFLRGGTALASGRGERLTPLPGLGDTWFVVVSPRIVLPRKTVTLYAALCSDDFSDGDAVRRQAARLRVGSSLDPDLLGNAFRRPLARLRPELASLPETMRAAGAGAIGLSGAGPSHYAVVGDPEEAERLATRLAARLGAAAAVAVAEPCPAPPLPQPA